MKTNNKIKQTNKIYLIILFLFFSIGTKGQNNFNKTKNWGISINYNIYYSPSISSHLLYKHKKSSFFAGFGLRKDRNDSYSKPEPEYWLGYRRYPFKNKKRLKFFYQTFLYYSANHDRSYYISNSFLTLNLGIGLRYDFAKRFTADISSNLGRGTIFYEQKLRGALTFFQMVSIAYNFNEKQK